MKTAISREGEMKRKKKGKGLRNDQQQQGLGSSFYDVVGIAKASR